MSLSAKYQYTHFIYPFVVEETDYNKFIQSIIGQNKNWTFKIDEFKSDEEQYNFFLPYMRKFLFPTLFWNAEYIKQFKNMSNIKKASLTSKMSCCTFEYNLSNIKIGSVEGKKFGEIHFDISSIKLICFEPGICFLDIKTEIDEEGSEIEFDEILDFNNTFRTLTPKAFFSSTQSANLKGKYIDKLENISIFIKSIISGFETEDLEKIYYDKMFTYSYMCVDKKYWSDDSDLDRIENDFYKFQYIMDSKSSAIFNKKFVKLNENTYSRWQYSLFGFSRESGVVMVSDKEKYNITRLPYNFEKNYLYMLILAFYQRISLINFSQDLLKKDKTMINKLKRKLTNFTHFSWYSQITNSEHGMDIWKKWQNAFGLEELYDEVHKEYIEYYDFVVASSQQKINVILLILSIFSMIISGISIEVRYFNFNATWIQSLVIYLVAIAALIYPVYLILRWVKYKVEKPSKV